MTPSGQFLMVLGCPATHQSHGPFEWVLLTRCQEVRIGILGVGFPMMADR